MACAVAICSLTPWAVEVPFSAAAIGKAISRDAQKKTALIINCHSSALSFNLPGLKMLVGISIELLQPSFELLHQASFLLRRSYRKHHPIQPSLKPQHPNKLQE
jgi:hypothetical protein